MASLPTKDCHSFPVQDAEEAEQRWKAKNERSRKSAVTVFRCAPKAQNMTKIFISHTENIILYCLIQNISFTFLSEAGQVSGHIFEVKRCHPASAFRSLDAESGDTMYLLTPTLLGEGSLAELAT
jgi:hypothetical protein